MIYTHDTQHQLVVYSLVHVVYIMHIRASRVLQQLAFGTAQDAGAELSWLVGLIMITLVCQEKGLPLHLH